MTCLEVINTLENLATEPEHYLTSDEVHAIYFSCAVIRSLPQIQQDLIDVLLDLEIARPKE